MFRSLLKQTAKLTDLLEKFWHHRIMDTFAGTFLVVLYLFMIVIVEFQRQGWLPPVFANYIPETHFFAVEVAFTALLVTEVIDLVFGLTRSFSRSIGIQLEILSLILLRDTFKKFTAFGEPLAWEAVAPYMTQMVGEALGALAIFVIIGIYYRVKKSRPITGDELEQETFIDAKKLIALGLLITLAYIGLFDLIRAIQGESIVPFFDTFYTVLIFTDVLMVLLSLRFSTLYAVTFRNFGYAGVTVFIRLALIAPVPLNAAIGVGTALFALGVAYAYKFLGGQLVQEAESEDETQLSDPADSPSRHEQVSGVSGGV